LLPEQGALFKAPCSRVTELYFDESCDIPFKMLKREKMASFSAAWWRRVILSRVLLHIDLRRIHNDFTSRLVDRPRWHYRDCTGERSASISRVRPSVALCLFCKKTCPGRGMGKGGTAGRTAKIEKRGVDVACGSRRQTPWWWNDDVVRISTRQLHSINLSVKSWLSCATHWHFMRMRAIFLLFLLLLLLPTPTVFAGVGFSAVFVCLSVCLPHNMPKIQQLRSPNLTQKCSTMSPRNPLVLGSKGKSREKKHRRRIFCTLVSASFF